MIEVTLVTLIVCAAGLLAQRQHYKHMRQSATSSDLESLAKELKDLKSNVSALNMKVGFNK